MYIFTDYELTHDEYEQKTSLSSIKTGKQFCNCITNLRECKLIADYNSKMVIFGEKLTDFGLFGQDNRDGVP